MSMEELLRRRLSEDLAEIDPGPGDPGGAERLGRRIRRRRRLSEAGAALAVLAVLLAVVALPRLGGADPEPQPAKPTSGSWRPGAPLPTGPRWSPVVAWTGSEVIVVGGGRDVPCPPTADCVGVDQMAADGAAYDPATDRWRPIADAPMPIGYWFRSEVVGQTLVLFDGDRRWLAYSIADDTWSALPAPPERVVDSGAIPSLGSRVYAVGESGRVLMLDVVGRRWSRMPVDRQQPALTASAVLPTSDGIFACGPDPQAPDDGDTPPYTIVDRWDGQSWHVRFPTTGTVGNLCEHWTGRHLVALDLQTAEGLDGDPPMGGRLDPATGEWSRLPNAPAVGARSGEGWSPLAAEGPLMAGWGHVYDDDAERWSYLGRPDSPVDDSQSAVFADGRLVVVGGVDSDTAYGGPTDGTDGLSAQTWIWSP